MTIFQTFSPSNSLAELREPANQSSAGARRDAVGSGPDEIQLGVNMIRDYINKRSLLICGT